MIPQPYRVICFFARHHGLAGLKALLSPRAKNEIQYVPSIIFTHSLLPQSEALVPSVRPEYEEYQSLCQKYGVVLYSIDTPQQEETIIPLMQQSPFDLIASISWRALSWPLELLKLAPIGGINLHRGALPQYEGAEPIKQALLNEEKEIHISARILEAEMNRGSILATVKHIVNYDAQQTLEYNVERLKIEITPYFGPLLLQALDLCSAQKLQKGKKI